MYVESFHRVLKIVYLESKQNRRVDHLLSVLLRFAKDKAFDQISKLEKGKSTHRIKEIVKRHRSAEEMTDLPAVHSLKRPLGQRWVYYNRESTDRSMKLDLLSQWNSLFNWTVTYKYGSDIRLAHAKTIPHRKFGHGYDPKKIYSKGEKLDCYCSFK